MPGLGQGAPPGEPVELPGRVQHGSPRAYNGYKCRCIDCQEWRRSYDRNYWQLQRSGKVKVKRLRRKYR
jgi:hypothetical protein